MPKLKLTKTNIDGLRYDPAKGQEAYWDTETPGFVLIVNKTCKTFFASGYVHGKPVLVKVGRYGVFTVDQARGDAKDRLREMEKGINPNEVEKERRRKEAEDAERAEQEKEQAVTLRQAMESFLTERRLKPNTANDYRYAVSKSFADWLDRPLLSITKSDVFDRHRLIQNRIAKEKNNPKRGEAFANGAIRVVRSIFNYAVLRFELPATTNPFRVLSERRSWFKDERRKRVIHRAHLSDWMKAVLALPDMVAPTQESSTNIRWNTSYGELQRIRAEMVRDYMLLLLFTGLRKMEAASLTWDAFDLKAKTLTITNTKNTDTLVLPLPDYLVTRFIERKANHQRVVEHILALTNPNNVSHFRHQARLGRFQPLENYVFLWLPVPHRPLEPANLGKPRAPTKVEWRHERLPHLSDVSDYIERITAHIAEHADGAKVEFSLHDLRRTFITFAESMDLSAYTIKALVNHRQDTSDVTGGYVVLDVERLRKAMTMIERGILVAAGLAPSAEVISLEAARVASGGQ